MTHPPRPPGPPHPIYPLAALAGQGRMRLALFLIGVDPEIGGVLLAGDKGTAKSTAVRGLAELLPPIRTVSGCPFHCRPDGPPETCPYCYERRTSGEALPESLAPTPFMTLPLGATEDRLLGGLDIESSLRSGRPRLSPGLLGRANRGYLYVDEVNLLEPYLAHFLLDAVEFGVNRVEREGLSLVHPSKIALMGSMNPEEGALGPQLADRFALTVRVTGETDPALRKEIVRRRLAFEADPIGFRRAWSAESRRLARRLAISRRRLPEIGFSPAAERMVSGLVRDSGARGHRGDLALARAARSLAAWENKSRVEAWHVSAVADLVLNSRRVRRKTQRTVTRISSLAASVSPIHFETPFQPTVRPENRPFSSGDAPEADHTLTARLLQPNAPFEIITPNDKRERGPRGASGRRTARPVTTARGRYFRSSAERLGRPLALDATFRAAAPHQAQRRNDGYPGLVIRGHDLREKVFRQKTGRLVLFVVDASGSVGSLERMSEAKAAAMSLLEEAYRKRDRIGLLAFHGNRAEVLLPPTGSVEQAGRLLKDLPSGGKTPLAAALTETGRLLRIELNRDPGLTPLVVLMTDGRPNVPLRRGEDPFREALALAGRLARDPRLRFVVVDTDRGHYADYKLTRDLARRLDAPRLTLEDLRRGELTAWLEKAA